MSFQRGFAPVFVALGMLLLIALGGAAYLYAKQHGGALAQLPIYQSSSTTTETDASPHARFPFTFTGEAAVDYTDTQYGFGISPPQSMTVQIAGFASLHPFTTKPVAYVYLKQNQYSVGTDAAYLTVNVSVDPKDIANCATPGKIYNRDNANLSGPNKTGTVDINGTTFAVTDWGSPNQVGLERDYTAVIGSYCYDIQIITVPSCSLCSDGPEPVSQHYNAMDIMDEVARQFFAPPSEPSKLEPSTLSVPGMTKYIDADFGFSFWYPSGWNVASSPAKSSTDNGWLQGGAVVKEIAVRGTLASDGVTIEEFHSSDRSITELGATRSASPVGEDMKYYFDTNTHTWMFSDLADNGGKGGLTYPYTTPADVSNNTMGGLHIFPGAARFGADTIVPLSANNFLVISTNDGGGYLQQKYLVNSVMATDPAVATPVGVADQTRVIQAEKNAYNTVYLPNSGFSFELPDGWSVGNDNENTRGDGYMLTSNRGGWILIQCPPVESNFQGFADLISNNVAFAQSRTFSDGVNTYTISYAEYNPATANKVGVLLHVTGGFHQGQECKIGGTADRTYVSSNQEVMQDARGTEQELVNAVKSIYDTWRYQ